LASERVAKEKEDKQKLKAGKRRYIQPAESRKGEREKERKRKKKRERERERERETEGNKEEGEKRQTINFSAPDQDSETADLEHTDHTEAVMLPCVLDGEKDTY